MPRKENTCASLLSNMNIQIRVGLQTAYKDVPLLPVPAQTEWEGNSINTDNPGINRRRLSS